MKKGIAFILLLCLCITAAAAVPPVVDHSGLLTDEQVSDLNTYFDQIRQTEGYGVNVLTTDTLDGKSAQQYAEDYYDAHIGGDGVLLVVCLQERYWYLSTNGSCARAISDNRANAIGERVIDLVREESYYEAFELFGGLIREQMSSSESGETVSSGSYGKAILICLVIGLAAGGITTGIMAYNMRTVRSQHSAADYVCSGSLKLTGSHDIYLYSTLHKSAKPKSNSSGGGGRSRGGSGGRI